MNAVWPKLKPGLTAAIVESGDEMYLETLYDQIRNGIFHLWVILKDNVYAGVIITMFWETDKKRWLDIPFAYTVPELAEGVNVVAFQTLEAFADSLGLNGVKFISSRPGFEKVAPKLGYKKRMVEWVKEV